MADMPDYIFDAGTADFADKVLSVSYERPVLVDFWATWCAPCKAFGPILEKVVASYDGKVALARINVDENRELAAQLGVQSIPTVKIIMNGALADEFTGAVSESEIHSIIDSLAVSDTEEMLAYAAQLIEQCQFDEAESIYASILDEEPAHSGARIGLARTKIRKGEDEEARKLLSAIRDTDERYEEAQALLGLFDFVKICEQNGGLAKIMEAAENNPDDLETRYLLGCCHAANNSFRPAFDAFLSIVKKNRQFEEGKAQKAMITLFTVVGPQNELTSEFRNKLAMELF